MMVPEAVDPEPVFAPPPPTEQINQLNIWQIIVKDMKTPLGFIQYVLLGFFCLLLIASVIGHYSPKTIEVIARGIRFGLEMLFKY